MWERIENIYEGDKAGNESAVQLRKGKSAVNFCEPSPELLN